MQEILQFIPVVGRLLIASLFINSAFDKIRRREVYVNYMESFKVTRRILPLTILIDAIGGVCILFGLLIGPVAFILTIYVAIATIIFHFAPRDVDQMGQFYKNAALVGGLLMLVAADGQSFEVVLASL